MDWEEYKVVVKVKIAGIDKYFPIDYCKTRSVKSDATIAKYPIEGGVTVSDHMYVEPKTLDIQGAFSLNGSASYGDDPYSLAQITKGIPADTWNKFIATDEGSRLKKAMTSTDRLANIQSFYEWVQATGQFCELMMQRTGAADAKTRFKTRTNMALKGISWVEKYNSMEFGFNFFQVLVANINALEVFEYGELYPSADNGSMGSLGKILQESGNLERTIIKSLVDEGRLNKADLKAYAFRESNANGSANQQFLSTCLRVLYDLGITFEAITGASMIIGGVVGGIAAAGAVASATGVGLLVGGVLLLAAGVIAAGVAITAHANKRAAEKAAQKIAFNLIMNYSQYIDGETLQIDMNKIVNAQVNQTDLTRLMRMIQYVSTQIENMLKNIQVYQITTNTSFELKQGQTKYYPLAVNSDYITLKITGQDNGGFRGTVYEGIVEGSTAAGANEITPIYGGWPLCSRLDEMSRNSNALYVTADLQYETYLWCPAAATDQGLADGTADAGATKKLSNYYVLVCKGRIEESVKNLYKTITDSINNYIQDKV